MTDYKYLVKDYGWIIDPHLYKEEDIRSYFFDCGAEYFECGQGFYQDVFEGKFLVDGKGYLVRIDAFIESAKQDVGERLYWVESIMNVRWEHIDIPEQKERKDYIIEVKNFTEKEYKTILNEIKKIRES